MQNKADEENLEEHRFDANNVHSRLNLTADNIANEIDVDLDMDGDHPSKQAAIRLNKKFYYLSKKKNYL